MIGSINYKKILLSASIIAFVSAMVFGGTQAFFSDTETSEGNVFAAGAIDLLVDSEQHYAGMVCEEVDEGVFQWQEDNNPDTELTREELLDTECSGTWSETDLGPEHTFFSFSDLKPGDAGENTISLHVMDNDAYMCAIIDNMQTADNDCNEPELSAEEDAYGAGNETCGDPGEGEGELQEELHFFAWTDDGETDGFQNDDDPGEGDNIWQEGEEILFSNVSGPASDVIDGRVYPLYTPESDGGVGPISGSTTNYIGLSWCYGEVSTEGGEFSCDGASASNITQTDSLSADITFYAEQARNNDDFQCPTLEDEPQRPEVGAALSTFTAPDTADCDAIVSGDQSIQEANNSAGDGDMVCVDTDYSGNGDTYPVTLNVPNLTVTGLGSAGDADIPGGFFIDESGIAVTGLKFTDYSMIASSENAAIYIHNEAGQGSGTGLTDTTISNNIFTAPGDAKDGGVFAKGVVTEIGSAASPVADGITVDHNVFNDWRQAMFFNTAANYEVANNDIYGNDVGVANDGPQDGSIHHNDFENNGIEAVGVAQSATNGTGNNGVLTVNTNNLTPAGAGNNVNQYLTDSGPVVDATGNFWDGEAAETDRTNDTAQVDTSSPEASAFPEN